MGLAGLRPAFFLVAALACAASAAAQAVPAPPQGPPLLHFEELQQLYARQPPPELAAKLQRLLTTPFTGTCPGDCQPLRPVNMFGDRVLRVAQWNIERGLDYDAVRLALSDPAGFAALMQQRGSQLDAAAQDEVAREVAALRNADVLVLNEVDWGVNRSGFRNVAADLAAALGMNYAYGVEFVEVDPITMGLDPNIVVREVEEANLRPGYTRAQAEAVARRIMEADPGRYLGLHGNAILSRYPLANVRLVPYQWQPYDWYAQERAKKDDLERIEGVAGEAVLDEQSIRQVRRGGRTMLLADIEDPSLPTGAVTIVNTHLEDMTQPAGRRRELNELLRLIHNAPHPVIVAGDMNTTDHDAAPTSLKRLLTERLGSALWWSNQGIGDALRYTTSFGWIDQLTMQFFDGVRLIHDPTARSLRWVGENAEAGFFTTLERFRFADGSSFDFRGLRSRTSNGRGGKLADSNQRAEKGFVPTSTLPYTYGPIGVFKIDWIFVAPPGLDDPQRAGQSFAFAPENARTLSLLNHALPNRISDHNPILTDIPLSH